MKNRTKSRILSLLLSMLMCIWLVQPVPLWAAETGDLPGLCQSQRRMAPVRKQLQMTCRFWTAPALPLPVDLPRRTIH